MLMQEHLCAALTIRIPSNAIDGRSEIASAVWSYRLIVCRRQIGQISRITGMIIGLLPVVFWIRRLSSARTLSLTMP